MGEERITMSEFKTVVADFKSDLRKLSEFMMHFNEKVDRGFRSQGEQIALVLEGQTEIKQKLAQKVDRDEFNRLEKRVVRLETKAAR